MSTGRIEDVDAKSSTCEFATFPGAGVDLEVEVDGYPTDYSGLRREYPGHQIGTSNGLDAREVAVGTSKHGGKVIAFYGSWYLAVEGTVTGRPHPFSASQLLAIARRVLQNCKRANASAGP